MGLLKQFEGMQLPAASELEWLVPEHDAPQKVGRPFPSLPAREPVNLLLLFSPFSHGPVWSEPRSLSLSRSRHCLQVC